MSVSFEVVTAVFAVLLLASAWADVRSRRIPNLLTMSGLGLALALRFLSGPGLALDGLTGALLAFVLALPFFVLGVLGGGDAKLLMAIGGFMGPQHLVGALLLIAVVGGVLGIADAGRKGILLPVLHNCGDILKAWATLGRRGANRTLASTGALAIPYGVAIAVGSLAWWFAEVRSL